MKSACNVRAAVYMVGGPHDGAVTPPVFALESATETVELHETARRDSRRRVRYRHSASANGQDCVLLIYRFDGYVTDAEGCDGVG